MADGDPMGKIEDLEVKMEQMKARLAKERAREAEKRRKLETRRKIIAGAVVLKLLEEGEVDKSEWEAQVRRLASARDIELLLSK